MWLVSEWFTIVLSIKMEFAFNWSNESITTSGSRRYCRTPERRMKLTFPNWSQSSRDSKKPRVSSARCLCPASTICLRSIIFHFKLQSESIERCWKYALPKEPPKSITCKWLLLRKASSRKAASNGQLKEGFSKPTESLSYASSPDLLLERY